MDLVHLKARPHETTLSCTTCCVQHVSLCGQGNRLKISRARRQGKLCTTWKKVAPCSTLGRQILSLELKTTNHTAYFIAMTTRYDVVFYLRILGGKITADILTNISTCLNKDCILNL